MPVCFFSCVQAIHSGHQRLAAAAQQPGQEHAGHSPHPRKVDENDHGGNDAGPQAVQRGLRQQHKGLEHQQAHIQQHPARVHMHVDHAAGVHRAQDEHQGQTQEGCIGGTHRSPGLDEEVVHDAVADGTRHHGDHAAVGLFGHHVHAVHELVEAAAGGSQHQEGYKVPGIIVFGLHHVHHRAAQPDDACRAAEQHAGIGAEDLGKELGAALFFRHGRKLPGIVEDQAQRGEDGGQEVAGRQQAAPGIAAVAVQTIAHFTHKEQVGCVDDPEADLRGDHGQGEVEHLLPQVLVDALQLHVVPQPAGKGQKQHADQIAADDGQQVTVGPPPEAHQVQHIKGHGGHGAQHAVHGHQLIPLAAAHKLGAQGAQAAHEHVNVDQQAVLGHVRQKLRNGPAQNQNAKAAQNGQQAVGEHLLFTVALVQAKANDGVGHAHGHKGNEQVGILAQDLGQAQVRDLRHGVGKKGLHDQSEQLGRKAGNCKDQGIAGQLGIFIAAGLFFVFQGNFASCFVLQKNTLLLQGTPSCVPCSQKPPARSGIYCFNNSRRAFQSGSSFATSAQKAGLWLGCKKWQYSCTTT